tara:strand:- start:717 stop:1568 length:852 start_codon:yes stop_codon:yes gene_type:complete
VNAKPKFRRDRDQPHNTRVIAISGGKGGVGKSNVTINLSVCLSLLNQRVMILDADLGLANIDVLLGLKVQRNLEDVYLGKCDLQDVCLQGPHDVRIIPSSSGTQSMVNLSSQQHAGLVHAFSDFADTIDTLVIDTAAGISDSVIQFIRAAQEALIVVCDEPSSLTDAYALIKLLHRDHGVDEFRIVVNQTRSVKEGIQLYQRLLNTANQFLDVQLRYEGDIPYDDALREAVKQQQAVTVRSPRSQSAKAFKRLAERVLDWPVKNHPSGELEFFVEQLLSGPQT